MTPSAIAQMAVSLKDHKGDSGGNISQSISHHLLPTKGMQVVPIPKRHSPSHLLLLSSFDASTAVESSSEGTCPEAEEPIAEMDSGLQSPDSLDRISPIEVDCDMEYNNDDGARDLQASYRPPHQQQLQQRRTDEDLELIDIYIAASEETVWRERRAENREECEYNGCGVNGVGDDEDDDQRILELTCGSNVAKLLNGESDADITVPAVVRGRSQSLLIGEDFCRALYVVAQADVRTATVAGAVSAHKQPDGRAVGVHVAYQRSAAGFLGPVSNITIQENKQFGSNFDNPCQLSHTNFADMAPTAAAPARPPPLQPPTMRRTVSLNDALRNLWTKPPPPAAPAPARPRQPRLPPAGTAGATTSTTRPATSTSPAAAVALASTLGRALLRPRTFRRRRSSLGALPPATIAIGPAANGPSTEVPPLAPAAAAVVVMQSLMPREPPRVKANRSGVIKPATIMDVVDSPPDVAQLFKAHAKSMYGAVLINDLNARKRS
ncbi:hypothetical protein HDU84_004343 [Entophlyctis sp. JEL0112]|nr:hypothetical protein HDU84_004343 [Entophlyctis sp. JEL0112]